MNVIYIYCTLFVLDFGHSLSNSFELHLSQAIGVLREKMHITKFFDAACNTFEIYPAFEVA